MTSSALVPRAPAMAVSALEDPEKLGRLLASSGYFSDAKDAAQAVVKVLAGAELGFGPIASMTGIYIVKGRVTLSANLMAAAIRRHPRYDYRIKEKSAERAVVEFTDAGKVMGTSEFTMDMARQAQLAGGENWRKYPGNMLLWRAMSNGAKFYCPDAFSGSPVYTPDELGAEIDPETGELAPLTFDPVSQSLANGSPAPAPPTPSDPGGSGDAERPAGIPSPVPAAPPAPDPEPEPAPAAVEDDPTEPVSAAEVAKFRELCERRKIPNATWEMALIGLRVKSLEELSKAQMADMVAKLTERFPA